MSGYGSSSDSSDDSAPSLWAAARAHENRAKAAQPMVGTTSKAAPTAPGAKKTLPAPTTKKIAPTVKKTLSSSSKAPCPESVQMPLEWHQVLYHFNPVTNKRSMDWKTSPIEVPHPELLFKGYVVDAENHTVSAFFAKEGVKRRMGVRCPRPAGGVNKRFFDGRKKCETDLDRSKYNQNNAKLYTPRSHRFGSQDPEI
jgi:hypothetical protein